MGAGQGKWRGKTQDAANDRAETSLCAGLLTPHIVVHGSPDPFAPACQLRAIERLAFGC
jgi:hypothetical protein